MQALGSLIQLTEWEILRVQGKVELLYTQLQNILLHHTEQFNQMSGKHGKHHHQQNNCGSWQNSLPGNVCCSIWPTYLYIRCVLILTYAKRTVHPWWLKPKLICIVNKYCRMSGTGHTVCQTHGTHDGDGHQRSITSNPLQRWNKYLESWIRNIFGAADATKKWYISSSLHTCCRWEGLSYNRGWFHTPDEMFSGWQCVYEECYL